MRRCSGLSRQSLNMATLGSGSPNPRRVGRRQNLAGLARDVDLDSTMAGEGAMISSSRAEISRIGGDNLVPQLDETPRDRRASRTGGVFVDKVVDERAHLLAREIGLSSASSDSEFTSVSRCRTERATAASITKADDGENQADTQRHLKSIRIRARARRVRACRFRARSRSLRAVFFEFVEQRLLADPQNLGGARFIVPGVFERQLDQRALGLLDGVADGDAQLAAFRRR